MGSIRKTRQERAAPFFARLALLQTLDPKLEREKAEAGFAEHLRVADLPARPLQWFDDAEEATLALRAAGPEALDPDWMMLEWRSTASLRFASLPGWACAEDIRQAVTQEASDFSTWHLAWSLHAAEIFRIASRVSFPEGEPRDRRQYLRSAPLLAVLASEWRPGLPRASAKWLPVLDAVEAGLFACAVLRDRVLAVPRPLKICSDRGILHSESGPAVFWPGGGTWYCWRGARVPQHVVMAPEEIQQSELLHPENSDSWVRHSLLDRYGIGRFMREFCAAPVQTDATGELFSIPLGDEQLVAVRVTNATPEPDGSRKVYFLRVPPDVTSARQGVAWTFGMTAEQYSPSGES